MKQEVKSVTVIVIEMSSSGDLIVFVMIEMLRMITVFVKMEISVQILIVLKVSTVMEWLLSIVVAFVWWNTEFVEHAIIVVVLLMLYMNDLMELLLNDMSIIVSDDRLDWMNQVDEMVYRLLADIQKKLVDAMVVTYLDSSSFSMIISNPIHLVIVFVIEIDLDMNYGAVVEMLVQNCSVVME